MGLLESLLPSVRGLRAPLSAGLVLLLAAWLRVDPYIRAHPDDPIYKSLVDLNGIAKIGLTAAALFVASLVGALLSTFVTAGVNVIWRGGWSRPLYDWLADAETSVGDGADHGFGVPQRMPVPKHLANRLRAVRHIPSIWRPWQQYTPSGRRAVRERQREWQQLRFRLMRQEPEVFSEIDRLEAETEFRFSVAVPVAVLGFAVAWAVPGSDRLYWIAGVVFGVLLVLAGASVSRATERAMADIVADRVVRLPVIAAIFGETPAHS